MTSNKLVKEVTSRNDDFAQWYTDLCLKAELMSYSNLKGFIIYRPYGYAIWENIQEYLDQKFKETGHENVYFPLLIPESLFQKEKDHVKGFAPETAMVTTTGVNTLAERLIIRPTSEVLFCDHFSKIVSSHRDLPIKYNQWCSVVRWEKTTRPFLRGNEFLWQEGHTVHALESEAMTETLNMLEVYRKLGEDVLAIPLLTGRKTANERFAGAKETYTIEALMYDGKALQSGTTHYFGTGFAEAFDIKFQDKDNIVKPVHQTSWGVSTRLIGAIIMVHSDDEGLVLPPYVAPTQVVIVPIQSQKQEVMDAANKIYDQLKHQGIRVKLDDSDKSPGWKFSEYELKGVPVRIEIGPRDLKEGKVVVFKRNTREKITVDQNTVTKEVPGLLSLIHAEMLNKAKDHLAINSHVAKTYDEFKEKLELGGYIAMSISEEAEPIIKNDTGATARLIQDNRKNISAKCPVTGKNPDYTVWFARAY